MNTPMKLLGVQTAKATGMMIDGKRVMTAIRKTAASGAVAVAPLGLVGDEQANPDVHGGLSKAVYAYPSEHYEFWRKARADKGLGLIDDSLPFGFMGENLTLSGLLETDVWVGDVLEFPSCTLRVTDPREPCFKFNAHMGFNTAAKAMAQSGFCGFYLAVDKAGTIAAGESFTLIAGSRQMSIPSSFAVKMRR
jgi:MOSC domain-containing protein YiiM